MTSPQLLDVEADFFDKKRQRDEIRTQLYQVKRELAIARENYSRAQVEAKSIQATHDKAHRLVKRNFQAGKLKKAHAKLQRRDKIGQDARAAYAASRDLLKIVSDLQSRADRLAHGKRTQQCELAYYQARHALLVAVWRSERNDRGACTSKRALLDAAGLEAYDLGEVYYYRDGPRKLHVFFGGGTAPDGRGISPDGVGHGHYVLWLAGKSSTVLYAREPQ